MADQPRRALTVRDVMTTRMVTTGPGEPVAAAAAAMVQRGVGSALIMQGRFLAGIPPSGTCSAPRRPAST